LKKGKTMRLILVYVTAILLCSAIFCQSEAQTQVKQQPDIQGKSGAPASPVVLPGAKGPLYEYVGKGGPKVTGADVGVDSKDANPDKPPKTRTLPSGTKELSIAVKFESRPQAESISIEVYNKNGKVEMAAGIATQAENLRTGEYTLSMDLRPKAGKFADGPYQAKVKPGDKVVAIINWGIGEFKE
jgi:hypothetical protein